jgi:hypothetical protein
MPESESAERAAKTIETYSGACSPSPFHTPWKEEKAMILRKKRVRNLSSNLVGVERGRSVLVGVDGIKRFTDTLEEAGFTRPLKNGESVVPLPVFGPRSKYNAEGAYETHKDQPMETVHYTLECTYPERRGPDTVQRTRRTEFTRKRYPRTFIPPPAVEMQIGRRLDDNESVVVSPPVVYIAKNDELLRHTINLYLEVFKKCNIFTKNLEGIITAPLEFLNWTVLREGERVRDKMRKSVKRLSKRVSGSDLQLILDRLELINKHEPDFVAVGREGFRGYFVFGFVQRDLYVCESRYTRNATYILGKEWKAVTKLTKAEILRGKLHKYRIIHTSEWEDTIEAILPSQ